MNLLFWMGGSLLVGLFIGLLFGGSLAAGARADQDFQDYVNRKDREL